MLMWKKWEKIQSGKMINHFDTLTIVLMVNFVLRFNARLPRVFPKTNLFEVAWGWGIKKLFFNCEMQIFMKGKKLSYLKTAKLVKMNWIPWIFRNSFVQKNKVQKFNILKNER